MKKYLQNKIAESKLALPLTMVYAVIVWLASGLFGGEWWIQFFCFFLNSFEDKFIKAQFFSGEPSVFFELLLKRADELKDVLMPGYTHLQVAMPSSFGLWLSAYAEALLKAGKISKGISEMQWHMLATSYIHLIFETVRHDMTKDEATEHMQFVCELLYPGWQKIFGLSTV